MVHDRGGDSVKVVIEGTAKEIASLVLELQERHGDASYSVDGAKCDADDLIHKNNDIAERALAASGMEQMCIR